MKKLISLVLVVAMLLTTMIPVFAKTDVVEETVVTAAGAQKVEYPIIFVTGIGQTWTHLVNEDGSYKLENPKDPNSSPIEYNLFYAEPSALLKPKTLVHLVKLVGQVVGTLVVGVNMVQKKDAGAVIAALLNRNLIDENGELPSDVEDCIKNYPISRYNELDLKNFYRSIPCQFMVEQIGADNIYCFNHPAFSFLYKDADALNKFIEETVLPQTGAEKVVLVPMSMGGAVTSAYLDRYGDRNEVKRVVSIVGAWKGSSIVADLAERKYADNAPELLYNGLLADFIGLPTGYIVNIALRLFPKKALRGVIDSVLGGVVDEFLLKTPSLIALVPDDRYEAIEKNLLQGDKYAYVRKETRAYFEAQSTVKERLQHLEDAYGMEFYFLAGYGLEFGEDTGAEYGLFQFMKSNEDANSDEIIPIQSTTVGATAAKAGEKLPYTGKYVSPDGSVDLSTAYAPDRTWLFYRQKHELEYNNTALRLALDISVGKVSSVEDCKDTYPQFNQSRNAKALLRGDSTYIILLNRFIDENKADPSKAADVQKAQEALDACNAMMNRTINDREADDAVIENAYQVLVELKAIEPRRSGELSAKEQKQFDALKKANDFIYKIFGAKGFRDFGISNIKNLVK